MDPSSLGNFSIASLHTDNTCDVLRKTNQYRYAAHVIVARDALAEQDKDTRDAQCSSPMISFRDVCGKDEASSMLKISSHVYR